MNKVLIKTAQGIGLVAIGMGAGFLTAPDREITAPNPFEIVTFVNYDKVDDNTYDEIITSVTRRRIDVGQLKSDISIMEAKKTEYIQNNWSTGVLDQELADWKKRLSEAEKIGVKNATSTK